MEAGRGNVFEKYILYFVGAGILSYTFENPFIRDQSSVYIEFFHDLKHKFEALVQLGKFMYIST